MHGGKVQEIKEMVKNVMKRLRNAQVTNVFVPPGLGLLASDSLATTRAQLAQMEPVHALTARYQHCSFRPQSVAATHDIRLIAIVIVLVFIIGIVAHHVSGRSRAGGGGARGRRAGRTRGS